MARLSLFNPEEEACKTGMDKLGPLYVHCMQLHRHKHGRVPPLHTRGAQSAEEGGHEQEEGQQ